MRKSIIYVVSAVLSLLTCQLSLAQDTTFNRVVTVEREYQPDIDQANKIQVTPNIFQEKTQPYSAVYSTYSAPVSVGYNLQPLRAAKAQFTPLESTDGLLESAVGHRNSHLIFDYSLHPQRNSTIGIYAKHDAYWGEDAICDAQVGLKFAQDGQRINFFANMEGNIDYWRYCKQVEDDTYGPILVKLESGDRILWNTNANLGISTSKNSPVQFLLQTGYKALGWWEEVQHIIDSRLNLNWTKNSHSAGIQAKVKNQFYMPISTDAAADASTTLDARHALRIEPYYAYTNKNFHLHAGVNIDMNISSNMGAEKWLSRSKNLGFAPSANIQMKWHSQDNRFHLYTDILGSYGTSMSDELYAYCPFVDFLDEWSNKQHKAQYTPVDLTLGFKVRPINTILIDLHAGYALHLRDYLVYAQLEESLEKPSSSSTNPYNYISTNYAIHQQDYHKWKIGASVHYHYRDLLTINAQGNYYFYLSKTQPIVYNQPSWDVKARVDVHIDSKWSIYSDNYFAGKRVAYTSKGDMDLIPTIALNIGGQYSFNKWLKIYLQVNNYLNRKNDIQYNFKEQGCHFLLGVKYTF